MTPEEGARKQIEIYKIYHEKPGECGGSNLDEKRLNL